MIEGFVHILSCIFAVSSSTFFLDRRANLIIERANYTIRYIYKKKKDPHFVAQFMIAWCDRTCYHVTYGVHVSACPSTRLVYPPSRSSTSLQLQQQSSLLLQTTLTSRSNYIHYDRVTLYRNSHIKMSGASTYLQKMRKAELVELADSVDFKE